ncbi:hypothetical protein QL898_02925 [Psychrobacter sp. APC 3279]|jgi:hypothetical protein|uniref:Uncharacterized protein n=1 Tax=Psychrobacter pacificensis TaxID=112002 RepID=A0A1G6W009_9GAMM|nr:MULTISPECIES: hypothetical protein [Psychrobacter]MDN3440572.1 hypothetical protein [Psychrobacter sp. APC 3279]GLR28824.1 hypothetical protein GCM10007915_10620 [Psychrobacter pacificensis]SDD59151.1 hypothetical protein SAMN05660405_00788 [Psychrobacter pacificensis]
MSNFKNSIDDIDNEELDDHEQQKRNDIAQEKAKQGRFDSDSEEDIPDSAFVDSNQKYPKW